MPQMPALFIMSLTKTATYKMAAVHPQLRFHDFQMSVLTKLGHKSTEKKTVVSLLFFLLLFFLLFFIPFLLIDLMVIPCLESPLTLSVFFTMAIKELLRFCLAAASLC